MVNKARRLATFICFFMIPVLLASFSPLPKGNGKKVMDQAGRTVIVPASPRSVVSLSPSNTEILFAIGAGGKVVGVTEFCNYPPDAVKIQKVGGFSDVNMEKIAELSPDLIFASHYHISKVVPALENLGFPVLVMNPETVPSIFKAILFMGEVCEKEIEAGILVTKLNSQYQALSKKISEKERISVFWELSDDLWTIGKGSYLDDLINKAGGKNIAKDLDAPWLQLSSEFIINADPDIIFLADHPHGARADEVEQRPGWDSLSAVKKGRIIEIFLDENDIVSRPGPRVIQALEYIAKHLYPDLF
ncbi:MAG: ABC transporter substrate-binding protein [Spirochaetales bacterium]|nr:ABC transporter substrate-binding protein [Spirochaetales bacterium]